jgi:hypothetical protein
MNKNGVHICGDLYFRADSMQYILLECGQREKIDIRTKQGTGEVGDYETIIGYYGSMAALIKAARGYLIRQNIADGTVDTIDDILSIIRKQDEWLNKFDY